MGPAWAEDSGLGIGAHSARAGKPDVRVRNPRNTLTGRALCRRTRFGESLIRTTIVTRPMVVCSVGRGCRTEGRRWRSCCRSLVGYAAWDLLDRLRRALPRRATAPSQVFEALSRDGVTTLRLTAGEMATIQEAIAPFVARLRAKVMNPAAEWSRRRTPVVARAHAAQQHAQRAAQAAQPAQRRQRAVHPRGGRAGAVRGAAHRLAQSGRARCGEPLSGPSARRHLPQAAVQPRRGLSGGARPSPTSAWAIRRRCRCTSTISGPPRRSSISPTSPRAADRSPTASAATTCGSAGSRAPPGGPTTGPTCRPASRRTAACSTPCPSAFAARPSSATTWRATIPELARLLASERRFTSADGDLILFDDRGIHRGGLVEAGERFMVQIRLG